MSKVTSKSGRIFEKEVIEKELLWAKKLNWTRQNWKPQKALIEKNSNNVRLYTGQKFNLDYFELKDEGWTQDHCDICFQNISEADLCAISGGNVICNNCFIDFI